MPSLLVTDHFLTEGIDYSILDAKNPEDLTEEEKVALLGRPCHGDNSRIMIRIRESKEFKVGFPIQELLPNSCFPELCGQDDAEGEQLDDGGIQLLVGPVHRCLHRAGW